MMKDDMVYLGHMLDFAKKIDNEMKGIDKSGWDADEKLQIFVVHFIQNIGEAARRVSDATKTKYTSIPWSDIIGIRNRIVHNYVNIRLKIVWDVAKIEIPSLIGELENIVPPDA